MGSYRCIGGSYIVSHLNSGPGHFSRSEYGLEGGIRGEVLGRRCGRGELDIEFTGHRWLGSGTERVRPGGRGSEDLGAQRIRNAGGKRKGRQSPVNEGCRVQREETGVQRADVLRVPSPPRS